MKRCKAAPKSHSNLRSKNNSKYSNFSQVSAELLSPARWESNQEWNLIGASPAQWQSAKHNGNSQEVFLSNCSFQIWPPVAVQELKGCEFGTAWSGELMQLRRRKATCREVTNLMVENTALLCKPRREKSASFHVLRIQGRFCYNGPCLWCCHW